MAHVKSKVITVGHTPLPVHAQKNLERHLDPSPVPSPRLKAFGLQQKFANFSVALAP